MPTSTTKSWKFYEICWALIALVSGVLISTGIGVLIRPSYKMGPLVMIAVAICIIVMGVVFFRRMVTWRNTASATVLALLMLPFASTFAYYFVPHDEWYYAEPEIRFTMRQLKVALEEANKKGEGGSNTTWSELVEKGFFRQSHSFLHDQASNYPSHPYEPKDYQWSWEFNRSGTYIGTIIVSSNTRPNFPKCKMSFGKDTSGVFSSYGLWPWER